MARIFHTGKLFRFITLFLPVLAGLYLYSVIMASKGGFDSAYLYRQWLEIGLVLYLYTLVYVILQPGKARALLAALPIFLLYMVHDVFYLFYGKVFRFINLSEVPELLQVVPLTSAILLVIIFVLPLLLIASRINFRQPVTILVALVPFILLTVMIETAPTAFANSFKSVVHGIVKYSDGKSVENNGRLAMLMFHEAQRSAALDKMEPYLDREHYEQQAAQRVVMIKQHIKPRNVHLIILESFLDPRLFKDLKFSQAPVHPDFEKRFGDKLGLSISPVFGGATAQAEFEILCGVPAFEKLSSVEFNVFTGSKAHCLPGILSALNYRTIASNAYKPNFFNAIAGYEGMGFNVLQFPVEFYTAAPSYLHFGQPGVEEYLYDKDLLAQNLDFVKKHLQQHTQKPIFNYLMTIYGHTPHVLDPEQRPEIIQISSPYADDHLQRSSNQFYYRSQAIAEYVEKLIELDKNSLIILIADHVPPLRNGPNTFKALRYMDNREHSIYYNRLAIIENGEVKKYAPIHHYELPDVVLNYLTSGQHCQSQACTHLGKPSAPREARLNAYLTLMAHASE